MNETTTKLIPINLNDEPKLMDEKDGAIVDALVTDVGAILEGKGFNVAICALVNLIAAAGMSRGENPFNLIQYVSQTIIGSYSDNMLEDDSSIH
jgi:hypothetical protein